jgi:hypothetical protein
MGQEILKVRFTGATPLLMHSDKLVNPLSPLKKEFSTVSSKRKKTDEDYLEMARLEWFAGMYHDEACGPYLPGLCIKAMLIRAATKTKAGPKVKTGVVVMSDKAPLQYDGPRDVDGMWASGEEYVDSRSVVVSRARVMRCRPKFKRWSVDVEVMYDSAVIDRDELLQIMETGGNLIGLGDYRLEKGGDFGRFGVGVYNG